MQIVEMKRKKMEIGETDDIIFFLTTQNFMPPFLTALSLALTVPIACAMGYKYDAVFDGLF